LDDEISGDGASKAVSITNQVLHFNICVCKSETRKRKKMTERIDTYRWQDKAVNLFSRHKRYDQELVWHS
jgi:hypothetical protein